VELNLNPYMALKGAPLLYELILVIEHIGNHEEGHCIAFTRREAAWSRCDDTTTSPIALPNILKCQAYILMYKAKETRKRSRAQHNPGDTDKIETGPGQYAGYATPGPKKMPPHGQDGPTMASEAPRMAYRGGGGLDPPNPEHEAASEEAKATVNKTPSQSTVPVKTPLMEGQE